MNKRYLLGLVAMLGLINPVSGSSSYDDSSSSDCSSSWYSTSSDCSSSSDYSSSSNCSGTSSSSSSSDCSSSSDHSSSCGYSSSSDYSYGYGDSQFSLSHFSLLLFTLEKNVLYIERYALDELAFDVNRISRKDCNAHCLYTLHLGDHGQRVASIDWYSRDMEKFFVSTYRGKANINYVLEWASLVIKEDGDLQEFMKAPIAIKEIFNADLLVDSTERKIQWFTALAIKWGLEGHTLDINLILERKIKSAACAIVPNYLIDDSDDACIDMTKHDLINTGLLTIAPPKISVGPSFAATHVNHEQEVAHQSISAGSVCEQSWLGSLCTDTLAQLAALKNAVCSWCIYC